MLVSLIKSALPHRFLYPLRRRFRDRHAMWTMSGAAKVRLLGFLFGGLALASLVLTVSASFRTPATQLSDHPDATSDPSASVQAATDGRAVPDLSEENVERTPAPIIATIDPRCAAHAREKLTTGLTNYYLQRRLRPGASSDDAAETSSLTGVLAGPGDPAVATPDSACQG